jgi:GntR family transcriptional regulator
MQIMEQVKHAIDMGDLRAGEQLPTIRKVAEDLVVNPNTIARGYRELEQAGLIEVRHGSGAYVTRSATGSSAAFVKAQTVAQSAVERLASLGLSEEEIRRLMENQLALLRAGERK